MLEVSWKLECWNPSYTLNIITMNEGISYLVVLEGIQNVFIQIFCPLQKINKLVFTEFHFSLRRKILEPHKNKIWDMRARCLLSRLTIPIPSVWTFTITRSTASQLFRLHSLYTTSPCLSYIALIYSLIQSIITSWKTQTNHSRTERERLIHFIHFN